MQLMTNLASNRVLSRSKLHCVVPGAGHIAAQSVWTPGQGAAGCGPFAIGSGFHSLRMLMLALWSLKRRYEDITGHGGEPTFIR
ncbi:hypothetical protein CYMTET_25964 [Cymbomonas tetramitiformis]|uniref:Uncharacterized protein n=1 Tax=Cymbomonas tetramitiformis TaxID=36881 RepID=A0AAE0FT17_9CHLO|nr:hypothetical protein CYMTET_25964 [Cymbomonas tetramitiformis]